MSAMHFYTSRTDEPASGYVSEGIAGYVYPSAHADGVALYRWRHPESNLHFYTVDPAGEAAPQLGYVLEKVECFVPNPGTTDIVSLYRWYHAESGDHLYTTDPKGELAPTSGYVAEGVACYVFQSAGAGLVPLFRWAAGTQTYCVRLLANDGKVMHEKNVQAATAAVATSIGEAMLTEYNLIHGPQGGSLAARAHVKLGGC